MTRPFYFYRTPLVDANQNVLGYKIAWQHTQSSRESSDGANLRQLLTLAAESPESGRSGKIFLDTGPAVLPYEILKTLTPRNTVLMVNRADLINAGNLHLLMSMRAQGFGLALCDVDLALLESDDGLLSLMTHLELRGDYPDLKKTLNVAKLAEPALGVLIKTVLNWQEFDACTANGLNCFFENLCMMPRKLAESAELSPQTVLILQLMQMVQDNADVRDLEKVLKRDATLSYKLFRYINSASFGIEVEIESLYHAVTMLGYTPLYRWLSLLLVSTSVAGFSPGLLQAAIVRGRFVELLGLRLLSSREAENLFMVGLFSLLDQLLGVSIQQVLRQISLPTTIAQALLSREGVYGPFLSLVQACELEKDSVSDFADALFMTPVEVNRAHLSALAWAQNLTI
jgi:c-di-GMP-related signal transduction protein